MQANLVANKSYGTPIPIYLRFQYLTSLAFCSHNRADTLNGNRVNAFPGYSWTTPAVE